WSKMGAQFKDAASKAKSGLVTAIEKIDPAILADIIIKATAIQETANRSLRAKGSAYRIGEITITATIPPQIGFSIERIGDVDEGEPMPEQVVPAEKLAAEAEAEGVIVSLEGEAEPG
ncbi:MAG TPA: hypothetical protein VFK38_00090, partial [Candidatus Limnocylindrales bacterium]|nr:hypothetical protein [Candidatus Limnocylindrales bacterium]